MPSTAKTGLMHFYNRSVLLIGNMFSFILGDLPGNMHNTNRPSSCPRTQYGTFLSKTYILHKLTKGIIWPSYFKPHEANPVWGRKRCRFRLSHYLGQVLPRPNAPLIYYEIIFQTPSFKLDQPTLRTETAKVKNKEQGVVMDLSVLHLTISLIGTPQSGSLYTTNVYFCLLFLKVGLGYFLKTGRNCNSLCLP